MRSTKDLKQVVVKKENESHDANRMAELEYERSLRTQDEKRNKMENFMNSTRLNASKIQKQQQQIKEQSMNAKKDILERQKELKARYTKVESRKDLPRGIEVQPTKVDWKRIDQSYKGVSVPQEPFAQDSDSDASGVDSEYETTNIRTPVELIKERENVRSKMLNKFKRGKSK